jgi:hypothetical protein
MQSNLCSFKIVGFGKLYVTYPVFSSDIDMLYDVIVPEFFASVKP